MLRQHPPFLAAVDRIHTLLARSYDQLERAARSTAPYLQLLMPEYQLRLPWLAEGDIMLFDNYAVEHRVVTDFYNIPAESRTLENIGTQGYPEAHQGTPKDSE